MILSFTQNNQSSIQNRPSFKAKFSDDEETKWILKRAVKDLGGTPENVYSTIQLLNELGTDDTFSLSSKKNNGYTEYRITNNTDNSSKEIIKVKGIYTAANALYRLKEMIEESMTMGCHKDVFKSDESKTDDEISSLFKKFKNSLHKKAGTDIHNEKINKASKECEALKREMHRLEYEKTKREEEYVLSCIV